MPSLFFDKLYNRSPGSGNPVDIGKYIFGQDIFGQLGNLRNVQSQNTYMTPEQMSGLINRLTAPAIDTLGRQYGQQRQQIFSDYAGRGQLFGGSLTGAQTQLGANYDKAISDLFSNVSGQLGTLDLQLGAQRQSQAMQLLQALFSQILGGEQNRLAALAGRPKQPSFSLSVPGIGGISF